MDMFTAAIADFGNRLGIPDLAPGPGGIVDLSIERVGRLQLEEKDETALVTLARSGNRSSATAMLRLAHWRENHPWTIHPAMKDGDWAAFTARIPLNEIDVPTLERLIGYLSNLLDETER